MMTHNAMQGCFINRWRLKHVIRSEVIVAYCTQFTLIFNCTIASREIAHKNRSGQVHVYPEITNDEYNDEYGLPRKLMTGVGTRQQQSANGRGHWNA